jgi:hypothetical protein
MGLRKSNLAEVVVVRDYYDSYAAYLSGRWYISPTDFLCLEVVTFNWRGKVNFSKFVVESEIREIQGERC